MVLDIFPATADRFDDVARLLAPRQPDAPACWCLTYRVTSAEFNALRGKDRPNRLKEFFDQDVAPGVVAYVDDEPAGWCAFGPRTEMGRLQRSRTIQQVDDLPVWSVVCFVVAAKHRRRGIASQMLQGAVDYAQAQGVPALEAYPVDTNGARISGAFAYVGTVPLFESAGFVRVAETASRTGGLSRWIMRRDLH
jgi:GNAT superfamily N-acetyltransferase